MIPGARPAGRGFSAVSHVRPRARPGPDTFSEAQEKGRGPGLRNTRASCRSDPRQPVRIWAATQVFPGLRSPRTPVFRSCRPSSPGSSAPCRSHHQLVPVSQHLGHLGKFRKLFSHGLFGGCANAQQGKGRQEAPSSAWRSPIALHTDRPVFSGSLLLNSLQRNILRRSCAKTTLTHSFGKV